MPTPATTDASSRYIGFPRSSNTIEQSVRRLAKQYPELVSAVDIGDAESKNAGKTDRDIYALKLGKPRGDGAAKPTVLWVGGVHGNENANPDLLLRWAELALASYGKDPELTSLLDTRNIVIVPNANPDGRANNERENLNGHDLNRTFGVPGEHEVIPEAETLALQKFIADVRPDLYIDWHSYGDLVLYPWGYKRKPSPDAQGLSAIAQRIAEMTGYKPMQAVKLYPALGSDDFVHASLKIPALTMETGSSHNVSNAEFETMWSKLAPVMGYTAAIADDPYQRAQGPQIEALSVADGEVTALAKDESQPIVKAEIWLSTDPASQPIPLDAEDGELDSVQESLQGTLPSEAVGGMLYVRAQDADGNWGPLAAQWA